VQFTSREVLGLNFLCCEGRKGAILMLVPWFFFEIICQNQKEGVILLPKIKQCAS